MMNTHNFDFSYTVKFFFKDKKYKIQIENVNMTSHTCGVHVWPLIQPVDKYEGSMDLSEKRGNEIFGELKKSYKVFLIFTWIT